ncbi:MAG: hypothetical protein IPP78_00710 [Holophagaceae bacterium]|nr:hypothetical protein [Holophagaceae bacterium]
MRAKFISVFAVAAETGQILASRRATRAISQVSLGVKSVPQVVFADWVLPDGTIVSRHSPLLRPIEGLALTVDLSPRRVANVSSAMTNAAYRVPVFVACSVGDGEGPTPIGVPSHGFTVKGLELSSKAVSREVITDLSQGADCYGEDGGFVVVETDPAVRAVLKSEIDLSNSSSGDPSSRMTDRYVAPSRNITGTWTSDGTNITVTLRVVDLQGNELLNRSATGPLNQFLDVNAKAARELAAAMSCSGPGDLLLDFESVIIEKWGVFTQQDTFQAKVTGLLLRTGRGEWEWAAQAPLDATGSRIEMLKPECTVTGPQPRATKPFRVVRGGFVWSPHAVTGQRHVSDIWIVVDPGAINTADSGNITIACRVPGGSAETVTGFTPFSDLFDMLHGGDGTIRGWAILGGEVFARRTFHQTGKALGAVTETTTFTLRRAAKTERPPKPAKPPAVLRVDGKAPIT